MAIPHALFNYALHCPTPYRVRSIDDLRKLSMDSSRSDPLAIRRPKKGLG